MASWLCTFVGAHYAPSYQCEYMSHVCFPPARIQEKKSWRIIYVLVLSQGVLLFPTILRLMLDSCKSNHPDIDDRFLGAQLGETLFSPCIFGIYMSASNNLMCSARNCCPLHRIVWPGHCRSVSLPRQTKPKKGQFMNFTRGIPEQKFNVNRVYFPKEKHQNS